MIGDLKIEDIDRAEIDDAIDVTVQRFSEIDGIDMKRLQGQIDYATKIIHAYNSGYRNVVLSAPTGFGKSILAFMLSEIFKTLKGDTYIMTSNKYLQHQYDKDIRGFGFDDIVMLKGQNNYNCDENGEKISKRACHDYSLKKVENMDTPFRCAADCFFIQQRHKARTFPTTVLNYSYWLTSMNKVYNKLGDFAPFQPRTLNIFDECHVMGDIVQDSFTTEINISSFIRRTVTNMKILRGRVVNPPETKYHKISSYKKFYNKVLECGDVYGEFEKQNKLIKEICLIVDEIKHDFMLIVKEFSKKYKDANGEKISLPKNDKVVVEHLKTIKNLSDELSNLNKFYDEVGIDSMVVHLERNNDKKQKPIKELGSRTKSILKLKCTNESELVKSKIHSFTDYGLFMSATVGNINDWIKQVGIDPTTCLGVKVPQIFSYEKSPIKKVKPMISMSYRNRDGNMKDMLNRVVEVIENHPGERGMVHTGNYELTKELENLNHPRIITYLSSEQKNVSLSKYERKEGMVICGPSLVEGVDFKNDLCRFMVFAKVPFLSLGDKLNKRKMEKYENWYEWATASNIMQALGRAIRNKKDWCVTYLLDSTFESFFGRYPLPDWVMDRVEIVKSGNLNEKYNPDKEFDNALDDLFD